jgi:hypothetical protein
MGDSCPPPGEGNKGDRLMPETNGKDVRNPLTGAVFPTIFVKGRPRAVIVDIQKFRELELLVDNLINLRAEDEDALLLDSGMLETLVAKARAESRRSPEHVDWEDQIDAL